MVVGTSFAGSGRMAGLRGGRLRQGRTDPTGAADRGRGGAWRRGRGGRAAVHPGRYRRSAGARPGGAAAGAGQRSNWPICRPAASRPKSSRPRPIWRMPARRWCAPRPICAAARRCCRRAPSRGRPSIRCVPIIMSAQAKVAALQAALAQARAPMGRDGRDRGAARRRRRRRGRAGDGRVAARATPRHGAGRRTRGRCAGAPRGDDGGGRAGGVAAAARRISSCGFSFRKPVLATLHRGDRVALACDGCPADLTATISFISPQAEYTPPLIYSEVEQGQAGVPDRSPAAAGPGGPAQSGPAGRSAPDRRRSTP